MSSTPEEFRDQVIEEPQDMVSSTEVGLEKGAFQTELEPLYISEFREIGSLPSVLSLISADPERRSQVYRVSVANLENATVVRRQGIEGEFNEADLIQFSVSDEDGQDFLMNVSPQFIWDYSGYWMTPELTQWSIENDSEIFDILYFALSDVCGFFGWTLNRIIPSDEIQKPANDMLQFFDESGRLLLMVFGSLQIMEYSENTLRRLSVAYQRNGIWLGRKMKFKLECYAQLQKRKWTSSEMLGLKVGDLLPLEQHWPSENQVQLTGHVICRGQRSKRWIQKIELRITDEDIRMEFENEDWDMEDHDMDHGFNDDMGSSDGYEAERSGPDAVELDLVIGATTLSFSDLCNIQEGSLVEIKDSLLPMVRLNIAGETILEGELVRLNQQLMIQVTKKVD